MVILESLPLGRVPQVGDGLRLSAVQHGIIGKVSHHKHVHRLIHINNMSIRVSKHMLHSVPHAVIIRSMMLKTIGIPVIRLGGTIGNYRLRRIGTLIRVYIQIHSGGTTLICIFPGGFDPPLFAIEAEPLGITVEITVDRLYDTTVFHGHHFYGSAATLCPAAEYEIRMWQLKAGHGHRP